LVSLKQIISTENDNLKKKNNMENSVSPNNERYSTQKVGAAIKTEKGPNNKFFRCLVNKEDLLKCSVYSYHNKSKNIDVDNFNLSLKAIKTSSGPNTHVIVDSIYHKSGVQDKFAEVNVRIEKDKIANAVPDEKGLIPVTVSLYDKTKDQSFTKDDYKVYITQPKGEKIPPEAYIGTANNIDHSKAKINSKDTRIERDFIGTAFIDHNEKLSHGQVLNASLDKEKLMTSLSADKKAIFVNFIPVKNNPEQLAAYVSQNKNDHVAQFTFKLEVESLKLFQNIKEGKILVSGYFDDKIENKNYNIKVVEHLSKEDRLAGKKPIEVGFGADKEHIQKWQQPKSENQKEGPKEIKVNKIPSSEEIKGKSPEKGKGLEH